MVTRSEAKKRIAEIVEKEQPLKTGQTLPIRVGQTFNVYRIPLNLLVPNALNDRITWRIREFEAENNRSLDIENENDVEFLYSLILDEHEKDNKRTMKDIAEKGQMVDGVITNDGIIIDGNRRATLLRSLFKGEANKYHQSVEKFRYFNAIVLPEDIGAKERMALETMIQIGSDKPVEYNRICLYIKVDNLLKQGYTYAQIQQYMKLKSEKEVEEMENVYNLMVEYLEAIDKPNHFTLLDGLEDQFINTKTIFKKLDNRTYDANWDYNQGDITEFKQICYDYMRSKFEGKKYRDVLVGKPNKTNGVFIEKKVWEDFLEHHNNIIDSNDPESEADWLLLGKKGGKLEQNLNNAVQQLDSFIRDKNISKLIHEVEIKVDRIDELISNKDEITPDDIESLRNLSRALYKITKQFD